MLRLNEFLSLVQIVFKTQLATVPMTFPYKSQSELMPTVKPRSLHNFHGPRYCEMTYCRTPYLGLPVTESPAPLRSRHPFTVGRDRVDDKMICQPSKGNLLEHRGVYRLWAIEHTNSGTKNWTRSAIPPNSEKTSWKTIAIQICVPAWRCSTPPTIPMTPGIINPQQQNITQMRRC